MKRDRQQLLDAGVALAREFCGINSLECPEFKFYERGAWRFDACAYYRPNYIAICVSKCASIGTAGRSWSYPGYVVDRTPFGVVQHELGHFIDWHFSAKRGSYFGDFSQGLRAKTSEPKLTSYCPNDAEWFAEIFRLYVTNPSLLCLLRPKTYGELSSRLKPAVSASWEEVLKDAPLRTVAAARKKIEVAGELDASK